GGEALELGLARAALELLPDASSIGGVRWRPCRRRRNLSGARQRQPLEQDEEADLLERKHGLPDSGGEQSVQHVPRTLHAPILSQRRRKSTCGPRRAARRIICS